MKILKSGSSRGSEYFDTEHLKTGLKKRAVRGAGATIFSRISVYGIQMLGTVVLARLLRPDNFGLVAMVTAFSLLLQNCGMRGFTEAIIQAKVVTHQKISTIFWIHLALSCALALLFIAAAPLLVWFYSEPRLKLIAIAVSFSFIFSALSTQHLALLARNMQFYRIAANQIFAATASCLIAIVLAWQGWGYWALVARRVALPLGAAVGAWVLCRWRPGLPARGTGVRSMLKFGLNTYGNFSLNYLSRNLDKVLIGWRYDPQLLGHYEKAYYLFVMPVNQLSSPLTNVAVAALSRLRDEPERYRHYYLSAVSMLAFVGMLLSAALTLIGRDFILLLLGPQWGKAGEIFSAFGPCIGILLVYGTHGWLHLSLGRADRWFRWGVVEVIATVCAFVIGLPFGAVGVAVAYGVSFYLLIGPGLWYAGRPINIKLFSLWSVMWRYYVCAVMAGLLSWFVLYSYDLTAGVFLGANVFIRIFVAVALCSVVYLVLVFIFYRGPRPFVQLLSLLREMAPNAFSGAKKG